MDTSQQGSEISNIKFTETCSSAEFQAVSFRLMHSPRCHAFMRKVKCHNQPDLGGLLGLVALLRPVHEVVRTCGVRRPLFRFRGGCWQHEIWRLTKRAHSPESCFGMIETVCSVAYAVSRFAAAKQLVEPYREAGYLRTSNVGVNIEAVSSR